MAQTSLNSTGVASTGALSLQSNGTTEAIGISTGQVATFAQNPILTSGTANGVPYLNGSKVLTSGSALTFDGTAKVAVNGGSSANGEVQLIRSGTYPGNFTLTAGGADTSANITLYDSTSTYQPVYRHVAGASGYSAWYQNNSEQMRLTSTGLGIGTSSPNAKIHVAANGRYGLFQPTTSTNAGYIGFSSDSFLSNRSLIGTDNSSGTGLWNTGGAAYALSIGTVDSLPIVFASNNTERARIDSSGRLMVNTTTLVQSSQFSVINTSTTNGIGSKDSGSSNYLYVGLNSAGTITFRVDANGDVKNTNNSYGAISDLKAKENITDATPKLEKLNQVRVVNFNMKGDNQKQIGVIAQELEQIFPSMVDESPDRDAEGNDLGTTTKSVKYSVFVPILIKAVQEQQSIIESLKARLDAANL